MINLDENQTEFRPTELTKIARAHTSMEKQFINTLCKQLKEIATDLTTEEMYYWDSTDQDNMPGIETLDHADLKAKNAFGSYFKQLLCRTAFAEMCAKEHEAPLPLLQNTEVVEQYKSNDKSSPVKNADVSRETTSTDITNTDVSNSKEGPSIVSNSNSESELTNSSTKNQNSNLHTKDMSNYTGIMNLLKEYNLKFIKEWSRTYNFHKWKKEHHPKCAYLDSGDFCAGSEFYKETVS